MSKETAQFKVDENLCTGCETCLKLCPGNMISGGKVLVMKNGHPYMPHQNKFGFMACWKCQHCMAACPTGAISVLGVSPEDVSEKPDPSIKEELPKLMQYRRSCRDFKDEEVPYEVIDEIMSCVCAAPTGGNNTDLQFSVVYTKDAMRQIYNARFPKKAVDLNDHTADLSELRVYNAPHFFVAHKKCNRRFMNNGLAEISIATAYFELLANAYGLGTICTTYAAELMSKNQDVRDLLHIPKDHKIMLVVGFGYPKYEYARGVKKEKDIFKMK